MSHAARARVLRTHRAVGAPRSPRLVDVAALVAMCAAVVLAFGPVPLGARTLVAVCLAFPMLVGVVEWPGRTLTIVLVALPLLAFVRRLLLVEEPWTSTDPLLLVAPVGLAIAVVLRFARPNSPLPMDLRTRLCVVLLAITVLQVANPRGGGLAAGAAGLLFAGVPLVWFLAGRLFATDERLRILQSAAVVTAVAVAVYGLWQTESGFPSWDRSWIEQAGYAALNVGGQIRAFATFSSSAEYGRYLAVGLALVVARVVDGRRAALAIVPVLLVALVLSAGRTVLALALAAIVVVIGAGFGSARAVATTVAAAGLLLVVGVALGRDAAVAGARATGDPLVVHQVEGLLDPFGDRSTAPLHLEMFVEGVRTGFTQPLGSGIATTTIAGQALGTVSVDSEVDVSNAFISLGLVGGFVYLALVILTIREAFRRALTAPNATNLGTLGLLVATAGTWLQGGHYALAGLIWFSIGHLSRPRDEAMR